MTNDGRFLSQALPQGMMQVGDEIDFAEQAVAFAKRPFIFLAAAAVFFCCLLGGSWWWQVPVTPALGAAVSFITIDINPSVELGVDDQDQVVTWEGLNSDGEKILAGQDLAGRKSADAVETLVGVAADEGYLAPEKHNEVIINLSQAGAEDKISEAKNLQLTNSAQKALSKRKLAAKISSLQTSMALRQEARDLGISAAKYAIYLEAQSTDLPIDLEQVKAVGVIKAIKAAGGNPGQIISMAKQDKTIAKKMQQWQEKRAIRKAQLKNQAGSTGSADQLDQEKAALEKDEKASIDKGESIQGQNGAADNKNGDLNQTAENRKKTAENRKKTILKKNQAAADDQVGQDQSIDDQVGQDQSIDDPEQKEQSMAGGRSDQPVIKADTQDKKRFQSKVQRGTVKKQRAILWLKDRIKEEFRP